MRILVLTDRFTPEIAAPSFRLMDHAQEWLRAGHQVTVVTCVPNFPRGVPFEGYTNRLYQEEWIRGVRVIRVWSYLAPNVGTIKRTLDYLSYMFAAVFFAWRYPAFDVLLASSPPLFVAAAGYAVATIRRRPWVFEIRDLWPASIKAVNASKGLGLRLLEKLEMFLYRKADRIISLTDSFKDELTERGISPDKNDIVTNGVDAEQFSAQQVRFDARPVLGVSAEDFLAAYIGTVGMAHGLRTVLDAAEMCRERKHVRFLIMGEGAERAKLEAEAKSRGLTNVMFKDFVPHDQVPSFLAALSAAIVHLKPDPLFLTVIPSKIFENMAMGTPMVYAVEGESARIVAEAKAGVCIPSGDAKAMADTILALDADRPRLRELGRNGVEVVHRQYSRRVKAQAAIRTLELAREAHRPLIKTHEIVQGRRQMSAVS